MKTILLILGWLSLFSTAHAQDITRMCSNKDSDVYLVRKCIYIITRDSTGDRLYYFYQTIWYEIYLAPTHESESPDVAQQATVIMNLALHDDILMIQYANGHMLLSSGIFLAKDGPPDWDVTADPENMLRN